MPSKPARRKTVTDIDTLLEQLGARIARYRKERGLSQAELAERLEVSQNLISAYEVGKVRIGADTIVALARTFKVSADELLGLKHPPHDEVLPSRRLLRRLARFDSLPRRRQDALLQTIDAVLQTSS